TGRKRTQIVSRIRIQYDENKNAILHLVRLSLRRARHGWMRRLLRWVSGLRTILWWLWWRSVLWRTLLRGLSGFRHCGGGRSALLPPRGGLLCRPHLLRLETRTLGIAERAASLDPRPLRRAGRILDRWLPFVRMVNDRLRQPAARQTEPQSCCYTASSIVRTSAEIDLKRFL